MTSGLHFGTFFSQIRPWEVPGRLLGTTLGAPLPPDLKKPKKKIGPHFGRYVEHIFHIFQVSFSKAFGPHVLDV